MTCPDRKTAEKIWQQGIKYRLSRPYPFPVFEEYKFHTRGVAKTAEKIASNLPEMDSEKAYVFGLLHDYGKRIGEKEEHKFHGQEGYEQMMMMGYDEVAQICLTHTFADKNFLYEDYSYPLEWLQWAKNKLKNIFYTDYDYLICLCDKFFEGMSMVTIEQRVDGISKRYQLDENKKNMLLHESLELKHYFDVKTGKNIYKLLELE